MDRLAGKIAAFVLLFVGCTDTGDAWIPRDPQKLVQEKAPASAFECDGQGREYMGVEANDDFCGGYCIEEYYVGLRSALQCVQLEGGVVQASVKVLRRLVTKHPAAACALANDLAARSEEIDGEVRAELTAAFLLLPGYCKARVQPYDPASRLPTIKKLSRFSESSSRVDRWVLGFDRLPRIEERKDTLVIHARAETLDTSLPGSWRKKQRSLEITKDKDHSLRYYLIATPPQVFIDRALIHERRGPFRVVLDPGHGGEQSGAFHQGLRESDLALDIALRTKNALRRMPNAPEVTLTRSEDRFLSLAERVAIANRVDADVFISIHLNGAEGIVNHGGVTTFVLDTPEDDRSLAISAKENAVSLQELRDSFGIVFRNQDQVQKSHSLALAERIQNSVVISGRRVFKDLGDRGVRSAPFYVLVGARMPAVLLEASFLSNKKEAKFLSQALYREEIAKGLANGIVGYQLSRIE